MPQCPPILECFIPSRVTHDRHHITAAWLSSHSDGHVAARHAPLTAHIHEEPYGAGKDRPASLHRGVQEAMSKAPEAPIATTPHTPSTAACGHHPVQTM